MKSILTTLAVGSIILVGGCTKTKKATANNAVSQPITNEFLEETGSQQFEMEFIVEVESDGDQMILNINGEEQPIDLDHPMQWTHVGSDGDSSMEYKIIVNGEEMDGDFHALPQHIMRKIGNGENLDVQVYMTTDNLGDIPDGIHEHIMQMVNSGSMNMDEMRDHTSGMWTIKGPEGHGEKRGHPMMRMMGGEGHDDMMRMHDQMIEMMGDQEMPDEMREMHERMMQMHERQERRPEHMREERRHHGESEVHEFMQELGMMDEMSYHLSELGAISMLGIHMIREELEPETRLEALERIIDEAPNPSPARNAALIVAIETLQELSREEDAADLMVELVISNAQWNDDD